MMFLISLLLTAQAVTWTGRQPQLAAEGGQVFLVFARDQELALLRSADGGATFAAASAIPVAGKLAAGMRRGPRIAVSGGAVLVSAVIGQRGGGADGDVVLFRSENAGRTWHPAAIVNDVSGSAREGLHAMAANRHGVVAIAWLDLREKGTQVFAAISRDRGATWSNDVRVYRSPSSSVCECCHPSVAVQDDGEVVVMFRNYVDGNRDMYVTRSRNGSFSAAAKLGRGAWALNACPMDGGDLKLSGNEPVTIWRREETVYLSLPGQPEQQLGAGRDPVLGIAGSHRDLAWSAADGILLRRGGDTRKMGPGRFPSLLSFDRYSVIAWEHEGQVHVRRVER